MMASENAVTIEPGETKHLTWKFTEEGEMLYGCNEAEHSDGGMAGTVRSDE